MEKARRVLKITTGEWYNENRDVRELSVVRELGAEIVVMAKGEISGIRDEVSGFDVIRMSTKPLGNHMPTSMNRLISVFVWAMKARKIHPDVISCHDLVPLYIGWISTLFCRKKNRAKLVYDSHEFTIYAGKKSELHRKLIKALEGFLIKKCEFTIEVNDQIAEEVQAIHQLKNKPVVVRNIPEFWEMDSQVCLEKREKIVSAFNKPLQKNDFLLMYHGIVIPERGIETLIETLAINPHLYLVVLGNGAEEYLKKLKKLAEACNVSEKILFHDAVPYDELWKYVGAADLGMILVKAAWKSYYYMLPNKFFENVQACTPVICSDFPVIKALVDKYRVGLTCNPEKAEEINDCIEKLRLNSFFYQECKQNMKSAKYELCWEKEKLILKEAYGKIL